MSEEPEPRPPATAKPRRNLRLAVLTGLTLAGIFLGLLWLGPTPTFGFFLVVITIAQAEFFLAVRRAGYDPATSLALVAGVILLVGTYWKGEPAMALVLFLSLVFVFIWYLATPATDKVLANISVTMLGIVYIPLLGSFAGLLLSHNQGRGIVVAVVGAAVVYDVFAYASGSRFGKTHIAPRISPAKTVEGLLGATVGILAIGPPIVVVVGLGPWSYLQALALMALIALAAPIGDLFESLIKRDLGIKDIGAIFPGHGGALDRIDAILFAAPAAYLSLRIFGL